MSLQHQQQESNTKTTNISDSYNTTSTVNRIFDNAGNTNVYLNSEPEGSDGDSSSGMNNKNLMIAAAVVGAAILLGRKS